MDEQTSWFARQIAELKDIGPELWEATLDTLYMVAGSTLFSLVLGFFLAVVLITAHPHGLKPRPNFYRILDFFVNMLRSFPFLILMVALIPFTRIVAGTSIGSSAAVVPLVIAATPFAARLIEGSFLEVDSGVIEAARSFGATNIQIVFKVLLPEALPSIILNIAILAITLLGYSAMAGTVGGGGLGDLAIKYGYHRFKAEVMLYAVVILVVIVQFIQFYANVRYKKIR